MRFDERSRQMLPFNQGLSGLSVIGLSSGLQGDVLYAATSDGVFQLDEPNGQWRLISKPLRATNYPGLLSPPLAIWFIELKDTVAGCRITTHAL